MCVPRGARVEELALEPGLGIISYGESFVGKPRSALDLNNVFVVNLRSGKKVALTDYKALGAFNPQITSDGAYVLAATYSVTSQPTFLVVWDARTGRIVKRDVQITRSEGSAVRYRSTGVDRFFLSPDRRRILLAYGLDAAIYDFPALREQSKFKTSAPVQSARALDARGDAWLLGAQDGALVRVENGALRASGASPGGGLDSVEIDAAASRAVTVSQDGSVGVWDTKTAALLATLASFDDDEYVAFTPGGAYSGTPEVSDRVGWVFDAPLEGFRFEQFDRVARRADVVRARLSGGGGDLSPIDARPPRIELVRPPPATVNLDVSEIDVRVTSPGRVDAVRAFVEGRPVVARAVCAAEADLSLTLPLMAGSNRVSVIAFDDRGFASNPITFDVTLADSPSAPRAPALYVVAAGVSTYPSLAASYQLDLADDDARAIAAALSAQVGPGKAFSVLHSRLLVDEQVTVASLKEALSALAAMRPEDTAVVFLAGHGVKPKGGDMVFLTSTADATQEGARRGGLGWKEIGERLAAAKGRVLVLLDACHSGDVSQELLVHNGDLAASLVHDQRAGALVFAAAKGRQLSYEGQTSRGGGARLTRSHPRRHGDAARHGGVERGPWLLHRRAPQRPHDARDQSRRRRGHPISPSSWTTSSHASARPPTASRPPGSLAASSSGTSRSRALRGPQSSAARSATLSRARERLSRRATRAGGQVRSRRRRRPSRRASPRASSSCTSVRPLRLRARSGSPRAIDRRSPARIRVRRPPGTVPK